MQPRQLVNAWVDAFNRADPDALASFRCGFFQVVDGKIAFQRGYWDKLSFLRAQGVRVPEGL
jgi:limonene-1,2-epoxide hydrolase